MRRLLVVCSCLCLVAFVYAVPACALTLTFEDLTGQAVMPHSYHGVQWGTNWEHYDWSQPPYTAHSGVQRLYNNYDAVPSFSFESASVFNGAWFAGKSTQSVGYALFDSVGNLLHTTDSIALSGVPAFLASGYSGQVRRVDLILGDGTDHFVMDDLTFDAVPEPSSILVLLSGVGALGALTRRRR